METLTRLVSESLARHGFDRPVDYRRLKWSSWFRCESHHSLLVVPSKPGVFAVAEEVINLSGTKTHVETAASAVPRSEASVDAPEDQSRGPKAEIRRMLAVTHFFEDDDMAFVLDRMLSHENPMRARLASGRYFVRFVEIHDPTQRRSICNALNQWIQSSAEKVTGIGSHFATSLELTPVAESTHRETATSPVLSAVEAAIPRQVASGTHDSIKNPKQGNDGRSSTAPRLNSAVATTIHCSSTFPSGF